MTFHVFGPDGRYGAVQSTVIPPVASAELQALLPVPATRGEKALFRHFQAWARLSGSAPRATPRLDQL